MRNLERFWDRIAKNYDKKSPKKQENLLKTIEEIKRHLNPEDQVLDFACATGEKALGVAACVQSVHGIDVSPKMIEKASSKVTDRQIDNAHFSHTDLFDEALKPGSYDAIMAFYVIHLVDDPAQVFKRIHELLKPDGRFISETPCLGEGSFLLRWFVVLVGKFGMLPKVHCFNIADLKSIITNASSWQLVRSQGVGKKQTNLFVVARKAVETPRDS